LKELNWTQAKLADEMKVSPQYVNKIVKGRENLTLETIALLETALGISLITVQTPLKQSISISTFSSALLINSFIYQPITAVIAVKERTSYVPKNDSSINFEKAA